MTKCNPEYLSLADNLLKQYALTEDDNLSDILSRDDLEHFQSQYRGSRVRDFPPLRTLSLFMHQVASENKSCRNTLIADARDQIAAGKTPGKTSSGAFCKARQRLTEESLMTLLKRSGNNLDRASSETKCWHNRRVVIADGSTLSMPDTAENQEAYPQHGQQKKGSEIRF